MKNVLLGFRYSEGLEKTKKKILEEYSKNGIQVELAEKYTKLGVMNFLETNSEHTDLILMEHIELRSPVNIDYLDELTDRFNDLNIILILSDEHYKTAFIKNIYNNGLYNCIFEKDATIENIVNLTINKRTKRQAKDYYGITDDSIEEKEYNHVVSDEQLFSVLSYLEKCKINSEELSAAYDYICSRYTEKQNVYIVSKFTPELKELLSENINFKKYNEILHLGENKAPPQDIESDKKAAPTFFTTPKIVIKKEPETKIQIKNTEIVRTVKKVRHAVVERVHIQKEFLVPSDYKKTVGIISSTKAGNSFLTACLACEFENRKLPVAVVDLKENRGLYYFFKPEEKVKKIDGSRKRFAENSINNLFDGINKPWLEKEYISLYTAAPSMPYQKVTGESFQFIQHQVMSENTISLWDFDLNSFEDEKSISDTLFICNQILIVWDSSPTRFNEQKELLSSIKSYIDFSKVFIVLNNYIPSVIKKNAIRKELEQDLNVSLKEIFCLPLLLDDYSHSFKVLMKEPFNISGFSKSMKESITKIGNKIYPVSK